MKISIITITCRDNPRLADMARTLLGSLGRQDIDIEWIIVDERGRASQPVRDILGDDAEGEGRIDVRMIAPLPSPHREGDDKSPAHNSARNAGLIAATGDYIVFLNDCTIVTKGWALLVLDAAKQNIGIRFKTFGMHDIAIPEHGAVTYRDHNDRMRPVPPTTVAGACWGAPRAAFMEIHGFDLAYDGEDKGHDVDAILRLARVGVKFVTSERAFVISLRRTKTKGEVSTKKEVFVGARNQKLLNQLIGEPARIFPLVDVASAMDGRFVAVVDRPVDRTKGPRLVTEKPHKPATKPAKAPRLRTPRPQPQAATTDVVEDGNHAGPPSTVPPELMAGDDDSDPLLDQLDD